MAPTASNLFSNAPSLITSSTAAEVCLPTHVDPALTALAMVAIFDAQDLATAENLKVTKPMVMYKESVCFAMLTSATLAISSIDGEPLSDQQLDVWNSHEHFWHPSLILKLLTCNALTNMDLDTNTVFEEEIVFDTAADDDLEFTSEDDIVLGDALCVPFSTSLFPHHDQGIIQDVLQESALQDVLHGFVSPSSHFVAGMSCTPLPDCFHQVSMLIHLECYLKHLGWLQFHLPVLYKVVKQ